MVSTTSNLSKAPILYALVADAQGCLNFSRKPIMTLGGAFGCACVVWVRSGLSDLTDFRSSGLVAFTLALVHEDFAKFINQLQQTAKPPRLYREPMKDE